MKIKLNVISAHISAAVASASALIALVHPGFHINPAVQATVASVAGLIAGVIELAHLAGHRSLTQNLVLASQIAQQAANTAQAAPASAVK